MKVDPSNLDVVKVDAGQPAHAARHAHAAKHTELATKGNGVTFSDQLESATKKAASKQPASTKTDPNKIFLSHTPPKGETTAAVPGHTDYRDILSGPRNGMYVNTSGGERDGEAFVLVRRHGVEYHIYGTGKEREVVRVGNHDKQPAPAKTDPNKIFLSHTPPKDETSAAVPGHTDYRDILSGPRNGLYVNTSGNERNGEAFELVHRHGREYHIYGTGKERKVVRVGHHHHTPPPAAVPNTGSGSDSTATPGGSSSL